MIHIRASWVAPPPLAFATWRMSSTLWESRRIAKVEESGRLASVLGFHSLAGNTSAAECSSQNLRSSASVLNLGTCLPGISLSLHRLVEPLLPSVGGAGSNAAPSRLSDLSQYHEQPAILSVTPMKTVRICPWASVWIED